MTNTAFPHQPDPTTTHSERDEMRWDDSVQFGPDEKPSDFRYIFGFEATEVDKLWEALRLETSRFDNLMKEQSEIDEQVLTLIKPAFELAKARFICSMRLRRSLDFVNMLNEAAGMTLRRELDFNIHGIRFSSPWEYLQQYIEWHVSEGQKAGMEGVKTSQT